MGAADRDVRFQPHQLGQHLGPAHHRQLAPPRLFQFRVARLDRGRDHDNRRFADILGALALEHLRAQRFQPPRDLRSLQVRPLHRIAQRDQHLGNARHADAADPDEMDRAEFAG